MLYRHIDKEDNVLFKFAEKSLSQQGKEFIDAESFKIEKEAEKDKIQERYIKLLEELEG